MNKERRKEIERAISMLLEAEAILSEARDQEQEYYDNMPENLQGSEKGDTAAQAASELEDACSNVEDAIRAAENAIEG